MSVTKIETPGYVPHWQGEADITVECEGCGGFYEDKPVIHWTYGYQISQRALDAINDAHGDERVSAAFFACWLQCPECETDEFDALGPEIWEAWGPWKEAGDAVCMGFDLALAAYGRTEAKPV